MADNKFSADRVFTDLDPLLVDVFGSSLDHSYRDDFLMAFRHAKAFNALVALYRHHKRDLPAPFYGRPMDDVIRDAKQAILERNNVPESEWDSDGGHDSWVIE
jgi:hypothetical protein